MANSQSIPELDIETMASLQRLLNFFSNERDIYKRKLESREICQATFDELDPIAERAFQEANYMLEQIQNDYQ